MPTITDYALMAGAAYISNRSDGNRFPVPPGWTELVDQRRNHSSGFEATTFGNGTSIAASSEIVISFAGTDGLLTVDQFANLGLATGTGSEQLLQAADYYLAIRAQNPAATITFTGHSLGGGLAALMGVFFDCRAVTFDQAPFAASARWSVLGTDVATSLRDYLASKTALTGNLAIARDDLIADLTGFLTLRGTSLLSIPRANLVSTYRVDGEFLGAFANTTKIGSVDTIVHGSYVGPFDLHAQSLLSAFLLNDGFRRAAVRLTDLLPMVFDRNLYRRDEDKGDPNFLEHLIRHQIGNAPNVATADAMLDRFTADLLKVAGTSGFGASGNLTDALIAFAMQAYYDGAKATDAGHQLYTQTGGGIEFLRSDIADSLGEMKGYGLYFQNYLTTLPGDALDEINARLDSLFDWYLAGTYLSATAKDDAAFMLGAAYADNLTGSTQADLLVGLAGNDTLTGGAGDDILIRVARSCVYGFRSIDRCGHRSYAVVIHAKIRDHAGRQVPEMREASTGAVMPASLSILEKHAMRASYAASAANERWRVAA
jgi:hypothetical protein